MNNLIFQDYFQHILNQFLAIDNDLLPWKYICRYCYYYPHDIYIINLDFNNIKNTKRYLIPISIDTSRHLIPLPTLSRKVCNCGLNVRLTNVFNYDNFYNINKIKELILHYSPITNKTISMLTSLEFLDLGMYSNITNKGLKKLTNLKILYLRNNWDVTSNIFKYLPNLHTIQIGYETRTESYCSIKPDEIPNSVSSVICFHYEEISCPYDIECDPLYCAEIFYEFIR